MAFDSRRVWKGLCGCVVFGEIFPFDCGRFLRESARRREKWGAVLLQHLHSRCYGDAIECAFDL